MYKSYPVVLLLSIIWHEGNCFHFKSLPEITGSAQNDYKSRIANGQETNITNHPYVAYLYRLGHDYRFNGLNVDCTGVIIGTCWILSAGHCYGASLAVFVGQTDADSRPPWEPKNIKCIVRHPKYNELDHFAYNYMILELEHNLTFSDSVAMIPLGIEADIKDGEIGTAVGYGQSSWAKSPVNKRLREAQVTMLTHETCRQDYPIPTNNITSPAPFIRPGVICAGLTSEQDSGYCKGDDGGPLILNGKLIGVASVQGCGAKYQKKNYIGPGIYSSVPFVREWIVRTISSFCIGGELSDA